MNNHYSRRDWLRLSTAGLAAGTLATRAQAARTTTPAGKAHSCIMLWLGGGAAQIDTFDPKQKGDGKKQAGSYYQAIPTAIPGVQLTEHLPLLADRLDRCVLLRTLHHNVIDEHGAATNIVHTGRPTSETIVYPSIGSIVAHQRGPGADGVPSYVVIGYPNISRGPGFLGSRHGYIYLVDHEAGPTGLTPPPEVSSERASRRQQLLESLRADYQSRHPGEAAIDDYVAASRESARLAGPAFQSVFSLESEPDSLRQSYGGTFGQRCLLARRLVESGVRFVEVAHNLNFLNGTGWDTHNQGQLKQHELIRELDQALAGLIDDLEARRLLDSTLVVVATEFGRPAEFDSGGGRGHQSTAFSALLAGGGLRTGQVIGATDDLAKKAVEQPVSIPDFHATIHNALGIDPSHELRTADNRPVPITDHGQPITSLFA